MSVLGLIFSNIHDNNVPELTAKRTVASIPFCGRYRLIDFALSNMVNSDITKVGIITKSNFQSLMDHIGSGKDWDLARHYGGLYILPPFGVTESSMLYSTRLEALKSVTGFLTKSHEEYVVMSDSDMVCAIDFKPIIAEHVANGADMTLVYVKKDGYASGKDNVFLNVGQGGVVTGVSYGETVGEANLFTNIVVISRTLLLSLLSEAFAHGCNSFVKDIIATHVPFGKVYAYRHVGYYEEITSMQKYYEENLNFLNRNLRDEIFRKTNVYTKVKDSTPTRYGGNSICNNSLVADGCNIEGEVYNSIIFRGVTIGRGAVVKNCVLMQNTIIGANASMNCIITDKNVIIKDRRVLSGSENHPFYISKGTVI